MDSVTTLMQQARDLGLHGKARTAYVIDKMQLVTDAREQEDRGHDDRFVETFDRGGVGRRRGRPRRLTTRPPPTRLGAAPLPTDGDAMPDPTGRIELTMSELNVITNALYRSSMEYAAEAKRSREVYGLSGELSDQMAKARMALSERLTPEWVADPGTPRPDGDTV